MGVMVGVGVTVGVVVGVLVGRGVAVGVLVALGVEVGVTVAATAAVVPVAYIEYRYPSMPAEPNVLGHEPNACEAHAPTIDASSL